MASLTVSSKYVEIQSNNMATVTIKNIKKDPNAPSFPILYKVKTNMKDIVDVRPSFGVVCSSPTEKNFVALSIKFSGAPELLQKVKLQITWASIDEKRDLSVSKMSHEDFNKLISTTKRTDDGTLILPFILKEVAERRRMEENRSDPATSIQEPSQESVPEVEKEKEEAKLEDKPSEIKFQSVNSEINKPKQKVVEQKGYSFGTLGFVFILAFLLGIFVGTKIQSLGANNAKIQAIVAQEPAEVKVTVALPQKVEETIKAESASQGNSQQQAQAIPPPADIQTNPPVQSQTEAQKVEDVQTVEEVKEEDEEQLDI